MFGGVWNYAMGTAPCVQAEGEPEWMIPCLPIDINGDGSEIVVLPNNTLPLSNATNFEVRVLSGCCKCEVFQ